MSVEVVAESGSRRRKRRDANLRSAPFAAALPSLLLFTAAGLWYVRASLGPWPLLLVGLAFVLRAALTGSFFPRSAFAGPLALFLLAAAVGAAISVDRVTAWGSTLYVYIGAVVMYYAVATLPERVKLAGVRTQPLRAFLLVLPSLIAGYFLLTTDWQSWIDKLGWLGPLLPLLTALNMPSLGHLLHPNVAGGLIAAMLPLQLGALRWRESPAWLRLIGSLLVALSLFGLLTSSSRGAWLALALAAGAALAARAWQRRPARTAPPAKVSWQRWVVIGGGLVAFGAAGAVALSLFTALPVGQHLLDAFRASRWTLWTDTLDLLGDTPLTGIGFEGFQMAYASYVLLAHVGYQPHSHNMLLEIWLRQGVLGLLAFAWLAVTVWRLRHVTSPWRVWALASILVIALHGLFDVPLYGARGMMLAFVPLALLVRAPYNELVTLPRHANVRLAAVASFVLATALLVTLPAGRALIQTNLGALQQTQQELALYNWPEWPIQDELRRTGAVDMLPIMARYQAALASNPRNAAANRRLGQIELALGDYAAARGHLIAAYTAVPGQRATRQLLAESDAIAGDVQAAARLLRTVDLGQGQLRGRIFWYKHIGEPQYAELIEQAGELARP